jgi:hypothetical protein
VAIRLAQCGGSHPLGLLVIQIYYSGVVARRAAEGRPM